MAKNVTTSSGNVFLDLGFPPHDAAVMLLRAQLAEALRGWMEREKLTQARAAKRLRIAQPRVSEIARGKVDLPRWTISCGCAPRRAFPWPRVWLRDKGVIRR